MERPKCVLLTRVGQLAREKELIKKGANLSCPFSLMCHGIICFFSKLETTRLILVHQDGSTDGSSPKDKFYARLEKHFQAKKEIN